MRIRLRLLCGAAALCCLGAPSAAYSQQPRQSPPQDANDDPPAVAAAEAADAAQPLDPDSAYENIRVLAKALEIIRQDYVDGGKVSYKDLTYGALRGMISSLDPHSQFMAPEGFQEMQDDTKSQFGGVGIEISTKDDALTIIAPTEDGPAARAGILPDDRIIKIDGTPTDRLSVQESAAKLRGKPGEKITLTIFRKSNGEVKDYTIEREIIHFETVKDGKVLDKDLTGDFKIGYVRLLQFAEPTAEELGKKLDKLEAEGIQALILDLRNNPGGLLDSAVNVVGQFVPSNTMVVFTDGRTESSRRYFRTDSKGKTERRYPVAVLINHNSASGSEIVAGALKDLNRAILVGETTFGKGSVQSVLPLPDGSAMRLTTAKYYTPSKQVIHEHGVAPHIRATMSPEAERALFVRRNASNLTPDEKKDLSRFRDTQLDRAIDSLKGLMIFSVKAEPPPAEPATPEKKRG